MEVNQETIIAEMKVAVGTIATITEIPEKYQSDTQKQSLKAARELITANYSYLFSVLTDTFFNSIIDNKDELAKALQDYAETLNDPQTLPPEIPSNAQLTHLEDLSEQLYNAQTTVNGILEQMLPRYNKWLSYRKHAENVMKSLVQSSQEWKSKAIYAIFEPIEVTKLFADFTECVSAYEMRQKTLDEAFKTMSRLVSIKLGTPTNPLSRNSQSFSERLGNR